MEIALCLSGQARGIDKCWPSFKKTIINPTNCDIFMSFAADSSILGLWKIGDLELTELELIRDPSLEYLYSIARGDTPYIKHLGRMGQSCSNLAVLRQFYFINRANNLKIDFEKRNGFKYDWVIRSRADVYISGNLGDFETLDSNYIYTPNTNEHGGLNDFFAFGSSKNMDVYSDRIGEIKKYDEKVYPFFNPHQELASILKNNNIKVKRIPLSVKRERIWRGKNNHEVLKYYGKYGEAIIKKGKCTE